MWPVEPAEGDAAANEDVMVSECIGGIGDSLGPESLGAADAAGFVVGVIRGSLPAFVLTFLLALLVGGVGLVGGGGVDAEEASGPVDVLLEVTLAFPFDEIEKVAFPFIGEALAGAELLAADEHGHLSGGPPAPHVAT